MKRGALTLFGLTAVWTFLSFWVVARNASEVLMGDQWDFLRGLIHGESLLRLFNWQHGPHRMGLGLLLPYVYTPWTGLSGFVESLVALGLYVLGAFLALRLKREVVGPLRVRDFVLVPLFLNPAFYESIFGATDQAHGPLPVVLTLAAALLAARMRNSRAAYAGVLVIAACATFTGFAFCLTLALMGQAVLEMLRRPGRESLRAAGLLAVGGLSFAVFFQGYVRQPAVECYVFPHPRPLEYISFLIHHFGKAWGWSGKNFIGQILGATTLAALIVILAAAARRRLPRSPAGDAAWLLAATSLIFAAVSAVGRVCLSPLAGQVSRYLPYAALGLFALYLSAARRPAPWTARAVALLLLLAIPLNYRVDADWRAKFIDGKAAWTACLLAETPHFECLRPEAQDMPVYPNVHDPVFRATFERWRKR